jgi:hypothetical protein
MNSDGVIAPESRRPASLVMSAKIWFDVGPVSTVAELLAAEADAVGAAGA